MQSSHIGAIAHEFWPGSNRSTLKTAPSWLHCAPSLSLTKEDCAVRPLPHRSMRSGITPSRPKV
jgi:hypothetical protein